MVRLSQRKRMLGYAVLTAAIAVSLSMCAGMFMAEDCSGITTSGKCGNSLTWEYTENNHTLTIKGSGEMYDWQGFIWYCLVLEYPSWYGHRSAITNIVLPEGLTYIGSHCFENLSRLKTVTIPDTVVSIGSHAFSCCYSLSSVSMSKSLVAIEEGAFEDCRKLSSVTLPDSLLRIGEEAFRGCTSLTHVEIPGSVNKIGDDAFEDCPVRTLDNNSDLNIRPGSCGLPESTTVYNHRCGIDLIWSVSSDRRTLSFTGSGEMRDYMFTEAPWNCISGYIERIVLPEGLTYVGINAFGGLTHLRYILIPDTVEWIGDNAFSPWSYITVYNRSGLYIEPGDFGLSQTARVVNGCPETVGVTFMDGGSVVSSVAEKVGMCYDLPEDPEPKDGLIFLGWFDSKRTEVTSDTVVDPGDETVLYAGWASVRPSVRPYDGRSPEAMRGRQTGTGPSSGSGDGRGDLGMGGHLFPRSALIGTR